MQREFLESVLPSGTTTVWRRGSYGPKAPIDIQKWYRNPEDFEQIVSDVEQNSQWDVYISPASYLAESRALENVNMVTTAWLDADTCELENLRVEPSWKIESSPGRWQGWWILDKEYPATDVALIVKKISYAHRDQGADVSSWASNKLMRVPGSVNSNHGFPVEVKAEFTGLVYTLDELAEAYSDITVSKPRIRHASAESDVEQPEDLPDYMDALQKVTGSLLKTVTAIPKDGSNRSDLRYRMLCDLFRFGKLSYDEVLSIAWHAPASKKWSIEDPRGINGLKFEADKAQAETDAEKEILENTPRPENTTSATIGKITLVTPAERKLAHETETFIDEWMGWRASKSSVQNPPYDLINGWTYLALTYGDKIYIPYENYDEDCNLYTFTLGQTTSGKTQAKRGLMKANSAVFRDDPDYNLGGNMSPEALAGKLLERDDKPSFINKDEVHGWLKSLVDPRGGYQTGLIEDFAELYDGVLPPVLRKSLKGDSGKGAHVIVTMHMMGTPEEVIKVLTRDMFKSGFLARFVWSIGNPRNVTKKSLKTKLRTGARAAENMDAKVEEWALNARIAGEFGRGPIDIEAVADRLDEAAWDLVRLVPESDPNFDILNPSLTRLGNTIKKCAALIAVANGRRVVEMRDVCYVLETAETWAANLISIGAQISASEFERKQDEVEAWISSRPDKRATKTTVTNRFGKGDYREFKLVMETLENRGVVLPKNVGQTEYYIVNENPEA